MDPGVARILAKSRKNNARLGVVGGLLFGEGYFLQCLEGDAQVVQNLYSKIETDTRHRDVTVLLQSSISMRTFGAWSMKYVPGEQRLQGLLKLWDMPQFDPYQLSVAQIDEAVRFMRDADDAVDTVPGELQTLSPEPVATLTPLQGTSRRVAAPRKSSHRPPGNATQDNKTLMAVVVGVALACLAVLGYLLLG
jgi:hypothetical protein